MFNVAELVKGGPRALRAPIQKHMGDYWGPPQFTNWIDESLSWKNTCYLGDWSFLPAIRYRGPDALKLFADTSVNSMAKFDIGQSKHLIHCNSEGKLIEDAVLSRLGEDEYIAFSTFWADYVRRQGNYDVTSEPCDLAKLHVQGPTSLGLLERLSGESLRDVKFMRFRTIQIGGREVVALRQGMTGELGFELQLPAEYSDEIKAEILKVGQEFGIRQMGGRVAMINHLEACYPTHCLDYWPAIFGDDPLEKGFLDELIAFSGDAYMQLLYRFAGSYDSDNIKDWYRSPVELGWSNRINFDHDFIGAEALKKELAAPKRKMVTLIWNSRDVVDLFASLFEKSGALPDYMEMPQDPRGFMFSDAVRKGGETIGMTSSRGYSAYGREMISLAVLDIEHTSVGTQVEVVWGSPGSEQRTIRATVAATPYKLDRARVNLATIA